MKEATYSQISKTREEKSNLPRYTRVSWEIWRKKYKIRQQSKYSLDTVAFILPTLKIPLKDERCYGCYPVLRCVESFFHPKGDERRKKFNCAIIPHKFPLSFRRAMALLLERLLISQKAGEILWLWSKAEQRAQKRKKTHTIPSQKLRPRGENAEHVLISFKFFCKCLGSE